MQNRYLKHAHISEKKFKSVLSCFCKDYTATQTAELSHVSRNTVNGLYSRIRQRIFDITQDDEYLDGKVEVDESYFGAKRIRGKRGRGAKGKVPVVGLLKRQGKVYTQILPHCTREDLMPILNGQNSGGYYCLYRWLEKL